jgi:hypothetical protein
MEWRSAKGAEVRAIEDDAGKPRIQGYAALFNTLSQPLGMGFRERIRPGAFAKTIKEADVRALFNHDPNHVLGRNAAGTLQLKEDKDGLFFDVQPPDEPWVRSLIASIKRGDISQASFAFQTVRAEWINEEDATKETIRELIEVRLFDVSPVTYPAYLDTVVQARNLTQAVADALNAARSEPAESHSEPKPEETHLDERQVEPEETHSADDASEQEPYRVRPLTTLVREHRIEREEG